MTISKQLASWVFNVGFTDHGRGLYRGTVNPFHRESVSNALGEMGLSLERTTPSGTEIWASAGDEHVVLVKYS